MDMFLLIGTAAGAIAGAVGLLREQLEAAKRQTPAED